MIGKRIKELRTEMKISQQKLADLINESQSAIARWEMGKTEPTASAIIKLADVFGVCADYLLGRQDWY